MNTMTDHELETLKQHCYAEGRADEAEACAEPMQQVLALLKPVLAEVAGPGRPSDPNSYLPPAMVAQIGEAIRIAEGANA